MKMTRKKAVWTRKMMRRSRRMWTPERLEKVLPHLKSISAAAAGWAEDVIPR